MGTYTSLSAQIREKVRAGMPLAQAVAETRQAYDNMGPVNVPNPTGDQLQEALRRDIAPVQRMYRDFKPTLLDKPELMQKRFAYSERCRDVLTKLAAENAEREIIFEQTAKRMFSDTFGEDKVGERISVRRWMWQLIDSSNTPEATAHNEEVVALVMLCESVRNKDVELAQRTFRETRHNHYIKAGMTEEQAAQKAEDELVNGTNRLMELMLQVADTGVISREEADRTRDAILSGEAEKQPGGLEAAYRKLINPGTALGWNILDITEDFKEFGAQITDEVYDEKFAPYATTKSTSTQNATVQQVANPFYAIFDGAELVNAGGSQILPRQGESVNFSAIMDFGLDGATGISQTRLDTVSRSLNRFALKKEQDVTLRNKPNDINVYSNGRGRTVILLMDNISIDNGFRMDINADVPGRLVNDGFEKRVKELQEKSLKQDKLFRSSGKYRDMKRALNALAETKLPDNPTEQQTKDFADKIKAVQEAAKAYNQRKRDQLAERGTKKGKDDYEQYRIDFGKELESYADQMAKRIGLVQEHIDTMKKVIATEELERDILRQGMMNEPDPNVSPFQRSVKLEDDIFEARERAKAEEARRAKEEAARKEEEEKKIQDAKDAVVGEKFDKALSEAEKNAPQIELPQDMGRKAGPKLTTALDEAKKAYENALESGNAKEADRLGRELVATMAVNEMVKCGYGWTAQLGDRFRNLAERGGLSVMTEQMMRHEKFVSRLEGKDFSNRQTFIDIADTTASIVGKQAVKELMAKERKDRAAQRNMLRNGGKEPLQNQNNAPQNQNNAPVIGNPQKNQPQPPVMGGPM